MKCSEYLAVSIVGLIHVVDQYLVWVDCVHELRIVREGYESSDVF